MHVIRHHAAPATVDWSSHHEDIMALIMRATVSQKKPLLPSVAPSSQ